MASHIPVIFRRRLTKTQMVVGVSRCNALGPGAPGRHHHSKLTGSLAGPILRQCPYCDIEALPLQLRTKLFGGIRPVRASAARRISRPQNRRLACCKADDMAATQSELLTVQTQSQTDVALRARKSWRGSSCIQSRPGLWKRASGTADTSSSRPICGIAKSKSLLGGRLKV